MDKKIRKVKEHVDKSFEGLIKQDKKRDKVVASAHRIVSKKAHSKARGRG